MAPGPGHEQLLESAYAAHADILRRRLTVITRDPSSAEDLTQEAFTRLVVEVRAGRIPDDIGGWLHRVGHNLAMSRGRRLAVADRHRCDIAHPGNAPSPETLTLEAERDRGLRAALAELGPTDQRALILAANGYRGPEIARFIGRTDVATRTLLCRARSKLRGLMLESSAG